MSVFCGSLILAASAAYVGSVETGLVGWINAAQLSLFGRYWRSLSLLVLLFTIGIPVLTLWAVLSPRTFAAFSQPRDPGPVPSRRSARPKSLIGLSLLAWGGLVTLVWVAVFGYDAWQQQVRNEDANAFYFPLDLADKVNDAAMGHHHLAARGRLLGDHAVSQSSGGPARSGTMLVPLVEQRWKEGDAVHYVIRLEAGDPDLRAALRAADTSLLAKTVGSVPTPARQVFQGMNAPLADDARTLMLVAAQDGRPSPTYVASDHRFLGFFGTAFATLVVVFFAAGVRKVRQR